MDKELIKLIELNAVNDLYIYILQNHYFGKDVKEIVEKYIAELKAK